MKVDVQMYAWNVPKSELTKLNKKEQIRTGKFIYVPLWNVNHFDRKIICSIHSCVELCDKSLFPGKQMQIAVIFFTKREKAFSRD